MLNNLFSYLKVDFLNNLVYFFIAIVFILGIVKCVFPVLHNANLLIRGVHRLEKGINKGDRPIWQEPRFLGRALQLHWQKFLLNAQHLDLRGIPCNTSDYINEDSIIYVPGHSQFGEMIPTLLTSLGILGTFIGLMQGLSKLDVSNAANTMESIPTLLYGMKYAFMTSIAGISCSLGFNILNRISIGHAFKAIDAFDEAFYELAMPRPLDTTVQLICQNQDSTAILKNSSNEITTKLVSTLEQAIGRSMQPVVMSMDNFIAGTTQEQIIGIQRIVNQFVNSMNQSLNGQFKTLGDTINDVTKSQSLSYERMLQNVEASRVISENISQIQDATHRIVSMVEEYLIQEKSALGASDESFKNDIKATLSTIQASLGEQNEFQANLKNYRDLLQSDYSNYIKKSEDLVKALSQKHDIDSHELKTIAAENETSMKSIVRNYTLASNDISQEMHETMVKFSSELNNLLEKISNKVLSEKQN